MSACSSAHNAVQPVEAVLWQGLHRASLRDTTARAPCVETPCVPVSINSIADG